MIEKLYRACMKTVSISIDGLKDTHDSLRGLSGAYECSIDAVRRLIRFRRFKSVQITTVVNKKNIDELEQMYVYFLSIGLRDWRIASIDPIGRAEDNRELLLDANDYNRLFSFITKVRNEHKINIQYGCAHYVPKSFQYDLRDMPFKCGAGEFVASILHNGDIYSCVDIERRQELVQGNILKDNFATVWEHGFKPFMSVTRVLKSEKCSQCGNLDLCGGDSAHTWDYEKNEPKVCLYDMLKTQRYFAVGKCGKCGRSLEIDATYCEGCGMKRGDGTYELFDDRFFQTLYGPPPMEYRYTCQDCGHEWNRAEMSPDNVRYCPHCGGNKSHTIHSDLF